MSNLLIGLVMTILVLAILGLIVGYSLFVERLGARRPKSAQAPTREETHPPPAPTLLDLIMSRLFGAAGPIEPIEREQRSYAMEHGAEPSGTVPSEPVPDLAEQLAALDDDALLDILARLPGEDEGYRFAESRIARFIPGRVEDRITQVRAARGTEKPPAPGRQLRIRDQAGERLISIKG
jgi:hypothetical protein